ncbi:MAG: hypothetical protein ACR2NN_21690 [Bryobacteraceae bacterium]
MEAAENEELLKRMLGPTPDCPAMERLLAGKLAAQEQAHVSECGHCKTELALYQSFEEAAPRPDEAASVQWIASRLTHAAGTKSATGEPGTLRAAWRQRWLSLRILAPASLAVASVLVAVGIVQFNRHVESPAGVHVTGTDTMRSQSLDLTAPVGQIAAAPKTLNWLPVAGAATYSVQVMEVDQTILWEANVLATSVALPDRVLSSIVPHKRILWDVTALDAQGGKLASSGTKDFVLITK